MPYPYTPSDSITFTGAPSPLSNEYSGEPTSSNPRELYDFEYDISQHASFTDATGNFEFSVVSGQLPNNLTMNSAGQISGTVVDLDTWVPAFQKPADFVIAKDGSNFATYGSAQAGEYDSVFTIRAHIDDAPDNEFFEDLVCTIKVINNYSSDRDQFIRDYSAQYGNTFQVNGIPVDANTYITAQNFPALTANTGYLPTDPGYVAS